MSRLFRAHETQSCIIPFREHATWTSSHPRALVEFVSFFGQDNMFIIYSFNCLSPGTRLKSEEVMKSCYNDWVKNHPRANVQFTLDVPLCSILLFFEE